MRDTNALLTAVDKAEAVYQFAALMGTSARFGQEVYTAEVNILGMLNTCQVALEAGVKYSTRMLFNSTKWVMPWMIEWNALFLKYRREQLCATGVLYTGALVDSVEAARAAMADSVRPNWKYWTADLVKEVHDAGLTASTQTVNDEETMEHLIGLGIDSIGTNYPDRLRAVLDRLGRSWRR